GVHVGNGMRGFESKYGFKFEYPESLNFQSANDGRSLSLDNAAMAEKAGQGTPVSTTKVEVEHFRGIADAQAVLRYARAREPQLRDLVVQQFGDAFGVAQTYLSSERLTSTVYFYTKAEAMVRMVIDAYGAAGGVELMSPVLSSTGGSGHYENPENIWPDAGWQWVPEVSQTPPRVRRLRGGLEQNVAVDLPNLSKEAGVLVPTVGSASLLPNAKGDRTQED
ncbi:MAG: hypothetical protein KDD51_15525, partial [Bdellovibrionales bacterium]|nr:hypothetical protein [Bdellovibrionales bacterium]